MAQTSKESKTAIEQTEVLNVFKYYLEVYESNQFNYYMAENSHLDWFGRSVVGVQGINQFLRLQVCPQYKHINFQKVKPCDAIEYQPSHSLSKLLPKREVDPIPAINKVTNISSLKTYADSDVEDDDFDMKPLSSEQRTPEKRNYSVIEDLTPPSSKTKQEISNSIESDDDDDDEEVEIKAKRLKRSHPTTFNYLRQLPTASTVKRKLFSKHGVRMLMDDTTSDEEETEDETKSSTYTPLKYLEATGILRSNKPDDILDDDVYHSRHAIEQSANRNNSGSWDREIRIKISYRRRISNQQLQFALIIYEHLDHINRQFAGRNLMTEFINLSGNTDDDIGIEDDDEDATTVDEQPALVTNVGEEPVVATVTTPNTDEIAAALESATFAIVPMRTPTKNLQTPPPTPKRKPRNRDTLMSGIRRLNHSSPATPKLSAARSLRL